MRSSFSFLVFNPRCLLFKVSKKTLCLRVRVTTVSGARLHRPLFLVFAVFAAPTCVGYACADSDMIPRLLCLINNSAPEVSSRR